jgi:transcriptional regulator with XRE-family HTH domain
MHLVEIGYRLRQARQSLGLTQAHVAAASGVSRVTLVDLENGLVKDLGIAKMLAIAQAVGMRLEVTPAARRPVRDPVALATKAANTGFRTPMTETELVRAFLTGKASAKARPHLRRLLEDSPPEMIRGLLDEMAGWSKPGRLARSVERLARELDVDERRLASWMKGA